MGSWKRRSYARGSATRKIQSEPSGEPSVHVPCAGLQIHADCRSEAPISHNTPLSIASNSQQNRLDHVVEVLKPSAPQARHVAACVTSPDEERLHQTLSNHLSQTKNVERQFSVLIPMSLNSFPSTDRGQPGSGFKIARRTSSATRESRPRLQLRRTGDVRSGKIAAQRLEEACGLIVTNLK